MTDKPKSFRYIWLIPLVILAVAMLACDEYYQPPPMVDRIEGDAHTAGRVYAQVSNIFTQPDVHQVSYQSDDYGEHWQRSDHLFAQNPQDAYRLDMDGENLLFKGQQIWTFPRSIFRGIFGGSDNITFALPSGPVSNVVQDDNLYIGMGTQGVLVSHFDGNGLAPDWKLSSAGMDTLSPLPLTMTNVFSILIVVVAVLFVPPFAFFHMYVLYRIWSYLLPAKEAQHKATQVTRGLVVLAIIGIVIWLTNERMDLYPVVAVLTVITAVVGVAVTLRLAQKSDVTPYTRNRLAIAAFFVSLIVPAGVASIFALWWLVFALIIGFWAFHNVYFEYLGEAPPTAEGRMKRWAGDRLTLETLVLLFGVAVSLIAFEFVVHMFISTIYSSYVIHNELVIPAIMFAVCVYYLAFRMYANNRAAPFLRTKPELAQVLDVGYRQPALTRSLLREFFVWLVFTAIVTGVTLFGQTMVYGWFVTLLRTKAIP